MLCTQSILAPCLRPVDVYDFPVSEIRFVRPVNHLSVSISPRVLYAARWGKCEQEPFTPSELPTNLSFVLEQVSYGVEIRLNRRRSLGSFYAKFSR